MLTDEDLGIERRPRDYKVNKEQSFYIHPNNGREAKCWSGSMDFKKVDDQLSLYTETDTEVTYYMDLGKPQIDDACILSYHDVLKGTIRVEALGHKVKDLVIEVDGNIDARLIELVRAISGYPVTKKEKSMNVAFRKDFKRVNDDSLPYMGWFITVTLDKPLPDNEMDPIEANDADTIEQVKHTSQTTTQTESNELKNWKDPETMENAVARLIKKNYYAGEMVDIDKEEATVLRRAEERNRTEYDKYVGSLHGEAFYRGYNLRDAVSVLKHCQRFRPNLAKDYYNLNEETLKSALMVSIGNDDGEYTIAEVIAELKASSNDLNVRMDSFISH